MQTEATGQPAGKALFHRHPWDPNQTAKLSGKHLYPWGHLNGPGLRILNTEELRTKKESFVGIEKFLIGLERENKQYFQILKHNLLKYFLKIGVLNF